MKIERRHFLSRTGATAAGLLADRVISAGCLPSAIESEHLAPRFLLTWGKKGIGAGEFHFPIGIAITAGDVILITDHYNHRVQKFDRDGKLLGHFMVLPNPGGIAIDKNGNVYLSHFPGSAKSKGIYPDRITVYRAAGTLLHEWGKTGQWPW